MLAPLPIETFLWCFVRRLILKQFRFRRAKELLMLSRKVASDDNKKKRLSAHPPTHCLLWFVYISGVKFYDVGFLFYCETRWNNKWKQHESYKSEVVRVRREISGKIRKQFSSSFSTLDQASAHTVGARREKTSQRALFTVSQTNWALISWF